MRSRPNSREQRKYAGRVGRLRLIGCVLAVLLALVEQATPSLATAAVTSSPPTAGTVAYAADHPSPRDSGEREGP
ncbi:hypothetical protein, partial [Vineibacter terrae]|uniref:hypothetical protein n=1 Tax=Vineibacter terrae TaxID=2586908 RepID=UPI002E2F2F95